MKKHYLFALMVALFAALSVTMLSSCGDDEDKSDVEEPENTDDSTGSDEESVSIIGTWNVVSNEIWYVKSGVEEEHKFADYSNGNYEIYTFKEDGTLIYDFKKDERAGKATGEYELDGDKFVFTVRYDEKNIGKFTRVISISDNTLTMTGKTDVLDYVFNEITVLKKQ